MKKSGIFVISSVASFILIFGLGANLVLAEATPSGVKRMPTIQEKLKDIKEARITEKENTINKVRNSLIVRFEVYSKLVSRSGNLLDKLQERIDRARASGKNVADAEVAMKDARSKLADATSILNDIKAKKDTAIDKTTFKSLRDKLQAVHKDLNVIHKDAGKIISVLKAFNSASPSATRK